MLGKRHPRTRIEIATDLLPVGKRGPFTPPRQRKPLGAELAGGKPKGGLKGCLRDVDCQFIYPAGVRFSFGALSFELFFLTTLNLWTRWWSMALYILSLKQDCIVWKKNLIYDLQTKKHIKLYIKLTLKHCFKIQKVFE